MSRGVILSVSRHPLLPGLEVIHGVGVATEIIRHAHATLVVGLCLAGGRRIIAGAQEWLVPEGRGFVIPPGLSHACGPYGCAGHSYLVLSIAPAVLAASLPCISPADRAPRCWSHPDAAALLPAVAAALVHGDLRAAILLQELATLLHLRATPGATPHPATLRAKAAVDAAPDHALSVADLAHLTGVSPFHLERLFVRDMGVPLGEYILARRVRLAAACIGAGASLVDVALACGFYDQSHLSRHFRRRMGVPPGCYREGGGALPRTPPGGDDPLPDPPRRESQGDRGA